MTIPSLTVPPVSALQYSSALRCIPLKTSPLASAFQGEPE